MEKGPAGQLVGYHGLEVLPCSPGATAGPCRPRLGTLSHRPVDTSAPNHSPSQFHFWSPGYLPRPRRLSWGWSRPRPVVEAPSILQTCSSCSESQAEEYVTRSAAGMQGKRPLGVSTNAKGPVRVHLGV